MKKYLNTTKPFILLLIVSVMLLNTSCDKENVDERPDLPPVESLIMDFSDFQDQPGIDKGIDDKVIVDSYYNFSYAYTTVAFWNAFTTVSLVVPVSSYAYALQQTPEYVGDDTWEWSYNFEIFQVVYKATLTGKRINNETFSMEMNIALASLPAVKVKYFDGIVRYDHTHANWNLYKNEQGSTIKVLETEWDKDFVTEEASMTYKYVEPDQVETNSFITWSYVPGNTYDAGYYISLSTGTVDIEWNTTSKAGHVRSLYWFENSDWHCWDSQLLDMTCLPE